MHIAISQRVFLCVITGNGNLLKLLWRHFQLYHYCTKFWLNLIKDMNVCVRVQLTALYWPGV